MCRCGVRPRRSKRECSPSCGAAPRCRGGAEAFRTGRRLRARASGWEVAVLIAGVFAGGALLIDIAQSLPASGVRWLPWGRSAAALAGAIAQLAAALARAVPITWVYDGLAVSAVLYAALFGLGIAAYRTLYRGSALPGEFGP